MTARPDSETPSLVERDPSASADSPSPTFRDVFSSTAASIAPAEAPATHLRPSAQNSLTDHFDLSFIETSFGLLEPESTVVVRPYKGDDDDQVLEELRPRYIIMYDPDQGFIRRIEVRRMPSVAGDLMTDSLLLFPSIPAGLPKFKPRPRCESLLYDVRKLGGGAAVPERAPEGEGRLSAANPGEGGEFGRGLSHNLEASN
jgi:hypothetical protein